MEVTDSDYDNFLRFAAEARGSEEEQRRAAERFNVIIELAAWRIENKIEVPKVDLLEL